MLEHIFLGIVQGITEFFPISSSAHLVILQHLLGITGNEVSIAIVLHLGTTLALIVFFARDIIEVISNLRLLMIIFFVTVITGVIGITGKNFFEGLFSQPKIVGAMLIVTAVILLLTRRFMNEKRNKMNLLDALVLGLVQGAAIIPGISRSGSTISSLLFRGLNRETSFRFSFLASIPAVLGAVVLEARNIDAAIKWEAGNLFAGFIFSFLTGFFCLYILRIVFVQKGKLYYFGYYCLVVAALTLLFVK